MVMNDLKNKDVVGFEKSAVVFLYIWQALKQKKVTFFVTFFLIAGLGFFFNVNRTPQYTYTQFFKVPIYIINDYKKGDSNKKGNSNSVFFTQTKALTEKINKIYLPIEIAKYNAMHQEKFVVLGEDIATIKISEKKSDNVKHIYFSIALNSTYKAMAACTEIMQGVSSHLKLDAENFFKNRIEHLNTSLQLLQEQKNKNFNNVQLLRAKNKDSNQFLLPGTRYLYNYAKLETEINDVDRELNSLGSVTVLSELMRSTDTNTLSEGVFILLFLVFGLIGGVFVAIISQFLGVNGQFLEAEMGLD
jgi:hypothetical protein